MTLVWYYSTRPKEIPERDDCRLAADEILKLVPLDPAISQCIQLTFLPACEAWLSALAVHRDADAAEKLASMKCVEADGPFDKAYRDWRLTVKDAEGKIMHKQIAWLLGVKGGRFPNLPYREEVSHARDMFLRLERHPELGGDPEELEAFRVAYEALAAATALQQDTESDEGEAAAALAEASKAFDSAWGVVVRTIKQSKGANQEAALAKIPRFRRSRKARDKVGTEAPAEVPAGEGAGAAASEPTPAEGADPPAVTEPEAPPA